MRIHSTGYACCLDANGNGKIGNPSVYVVTPLVKDCKRKGGDGFEIQQERKYEPKTARGSTRGTLGPVKRSCGGTMVRCCGAATVGSRLKASQARNRYLYARALSRSISKQSKGKERREREKPASYVFFQGTVNLTRTTPKFWGLKDEPGSIVGS